MKKIAALIATFVACILTLSPSNAPPAVASDAPSPWVAGALDHANPTLDFELGICIDPVEAADCINCSPRESTGTCKGANQCTSSRAACRKGGCKITGTASCSTAANVKKCSP